MSDPKPEFRHFRINTEFGLTPYQLPQDFTTIFQPFPHIWWYIGRNKGFSKLIAPINHQNTSDFLQISHIELKDQTFDVPKRVDQIRNTCVLGTEEFVLSTIFMEITASLDHISSECIKKGRRTVLTYIAIIAELSFKSRTH